MKMMDTCDRNPKNSKGTTFGPLYKKPVAEKMANICQQFCPLRLALLLCTLNHPSPLRTWEHCNCQGATCFEKACKFAGKHHAKRPFSGLASHWFQTSVVRSYPNSRFWNGPRAAQELQHTDLMQLQQIHLATVDSQLPRTNSPLPGAIPLEKCDPLHCPGAMPKLSKAAGSPRFGWGR